MQGLSQDLLIMAESKFQIWQVLAVGLCWQWLIAIALCTRLVSYLDINAAGSPAYIMHSHTVTSWHVLSKCSHIFAPHKTLECRVYLKAQTPAIWYEYHVTCIKYVSNDRIIDYNKHRIKLITAMTQARCTNLRFHILFAIASTPCLYCAKVPGEPRR